MPGGEEGPGGVLVLAENWVIWHNLEQDSIRAPLPRRFGTQDDKGVLIVSATTHTQKNLFFFLLQSEYGDIYKVNLLPRREALILLSRFFLFRNSYRLGVYCA